MAAGAVAMAAAAACAPPAPPGGAAPSPRPRRMAQAAAPPPEPDPDPDPAPARRPRGRPRIRTDLELEQRRKAWYRQRYLRSVYLGRQSERWGRVRQQLGHGKDEQTARALLDSFTERSRHSCSGKGCSVDNIDHLHTSCDALRLLIVWSHDHSQECGFIPNLKSIVSGCAADSVTVVWTCAGGHSYSWEMLASLAGTAEEETQETETARAPGRTRRRVLGALPANGKGSRTRSKEGAREATPSEGRAGIQDTGSGTELGAGSCPGQEEARNSGNGPAQGPETEGRAGNCPISPLAPLETVGQVDGQPRGPMEDGGGRGSAEAENSDLLQLVCESDGEESTQAREPGSGQEQGPQSREEQIAETELLLTSDNGCEDEEEELTDVDSDDVYEYFDDPKDENYIPSSDSGSDRAKRRGRPRRNSVKKPPDEAVERRPARKRQDRGDAVERPKKIRKKIPKEYVRCEFEGCGKIVSNPQYLKRHMKYQHQLQRTFACSYPGCGRIFRFKTQMEEHEKLHSDQRNYICEFCGRAFKTDKNLVVHRRIHTGEKPLQCEICGFTCRQKASLNWHMKKHDAESGYQFSCDVCGKRFEKKDNVSAHKSKSHPEMLVASVTSLSALEESGAFGVFPTFSQGRSPSPEPHLPGTGALDNWRRLGPEEG